MTVTYGITEERYSIGLDSRIAYGIAAYADAEDNGSAIILISIHDISSDRASLEKLILACNRLKLSYEQLRDVVDDFLAA